MPANQKKYNYYCLENTYIITNIILKEGYRMGHNILRHASLGQYNYFDTHEAEYHYAIFNHCCDMYSYCNIDMHVYVRMCVQIFFRSISK